MIRRHLSLWGGFWRQSQPMQQRALPWGTQNGRRMACPTCAKASRSRCFTAQCQETPARNTREAAQKAQDCALAACIRKFNSAKLCHSNDFSTHRGFTVVYVGTKGDNQYLYSAGYSRYSRGEAVREASQNKFPVDSATLALDFFESDGRVAHNRKHDPGFKGR